MAERLGGRRVGVILSGGNLDLSRLAALLGGPDAEDGHRRQQPRDQ
jgi:threonine dehydratase